MKRGQQRTGYPSVYQTHKEGESFLERHPVIPPISIYQAFRWLNKFHRRDAAVSCGEAVWTFRELDHDIETLSASFLALGIRRGDIISICMPNFYQGIAAFFAANRIGAVVSFLNDRSTLEEIRHYLKLFRSPLLINYASDEEYNEMLVKGTSVRHVVTLREDEIHRHFQGAKDGKVDITALQLRYQDLFLLDAEKCRTKWPHSSQNALILFTSGTTGNPKAVVLTNQNILAAAIYLKNSSHISNTRGEKSLVCVPFTYPYGFSTSVLMSLLCGREAILAPYLSADTISGYLEKKPNIIFGSPALLELVMRGTPDTQDLSSVTTFISGGDYLTVAHEAQGRDFFLKHRSRVTMCNGSGNAETASCGTNLVGIKPRRGTVGRVLTGSDAIVIDPDSRRELRYGEEGVLCISGRHVFKEYYGEPKLTAASKIRYKGRTYFITGTMGRLDEDGYFTLTGREARFYITSTLNKVYCDRIQNVICALPGVRACAVVKKPHKDTLFTNKAYIVLMPDVPSTEETLEYIRKRCGEPVLLPGGKERVQLKPYEIPGDIEFIEKLPRTAADKIDFTVLEKMAAEGR